MKAILKITLITAALALSLTGCMASNTTSTKGEDEPLKSYTFYQDTPTGKVLCIAAKDIMSGGTAISCDWSNR